MTANDKHAHGNCIWVDLMTTSTADARTFYGGLFGWTFDEGPPESGPYITAKLGSAKIAGMGPKPRGPMPVAWTSYLGVADAEATCAKIKDAGGIVMVPPMTVFDEGRMAVVADPTGGVFGLWQSMKHTGFERQDEPGAFTWTELYTRDHDKAVAFFTTVFGYTAKKMEGSMVYSTLHLGDETVGGVMQMSEPQFPVGVPAHWNVYFAVANLDQTIATLKQLGGTLVHGPFPSPYGTIAVASDPQGGTFCAIQQP